MSQALTELTPKNHVSIIFYLAGKTIINLDPIQEGGNNEENYQKDNE